MAEDPNWREDDDEEDEVTDTEELQEEHDDFEEKHIGTRQYEEIEKENINEENEHNDEIEREENKQERHLYDFRIRATEQQDKCNRVKDKLSILQKKIELKISNPNILEKLQENGYSMVFLEEETDEVKNLFKKSAKFILEETDEVKNLFKKYAKFILENKFCNFNIFLARCVDNFFREKHDVIIPSVNKVVKLIRGKRTVYLFGYSKKTMQMIQTIAQLTDQIPECISVFSDIGLRLSKMFDPSVELYQIFFDQLLSYITHENWLGINDKLYTDFDAYTKFCQSFIMKNKNIELNYFWRKLSAEEREDILKKSLYAAWSNLQHSPNATKEQKILEKKELFQPIFYLLFCVNLFLENDLELIESSSKFRPIYRLKMFAIVDTIFVSDYVDVLQQFGFEVVNELQGEKKVVVKPNFLL